MHREARGHCSAFPLIHNSSQKSLHFSSSTPLSSPLPSPATFSPEASPDLDPPLPESNGWSELCEEDFLLLQVYLSSGKKLAEFRLKCTVEKIIVVSGQWTKVIDPGTGE